MFGFVGAAIAAKLGKREEDCRARAKHLMQQRLLQISSDLSGISIHDSGDSNSSLEASGPKIDVQRPHPTIPHIQTTHIGSLKGYETPPSRSPLKLSQERPTTPRTLSQPKISSPILFL
jgi:hypothetical protein